MRSRFIYNEFCLVFGSNYFSPKALFLSAIGQVELPVAYTIF